MDYVVWIAEGPATIAGVLPIEARNALEGAGFREAGDLDQSNAVWTGNPDATEPQHEGVRRVVYLFDADDEAEALQAARDIVGDRFAIVVTTRQVGEP
jgi:hypothetical protein